MEQPGQESGQAPPPPGESGPPVPETSWGPKLFAAAFVAVTVFFWWLLIYSHGVAPHHG